MQRTVAVHSVPPYKTGSNPSSGQAGVARDGPAPLAVPAAEETRSTPYGPKRRELGAHLDSAESMAMKEAVFSAERVRSRHCRLNPLEDVEVRHGCDE